ncbi:MAG TPA: ABC transporter ATP-binding protein [Candidatus Dormibacteraeota bacterium]|jgi:ABC-type branched-subunit amino acid transport system ATPase component
MPLLEVSDLRRSFGGVAAVDGASFTVEGGALTGLIGPNGAGKSTVVGLIAGSVRATGGRIAFRGQPITNRSEMERSRLGITRTYQLSSEFARLTVMDNLLVGPKHQPGEVLVGAMMGRHHWGRIEDANIVKARSLLSRFGMADAENAYAGELSGGQKRLVEIMRALMSDPQLLLLDEPMAGVNPVRILEIESVLTALRREGVTMLLVEHELDTVERLCDAVIVMARGRVVATGGMADLRSRGEVVDAYLVG